MTADDLPPTVRATLHAVYDRELALLPENLSVKPVHVANGLVRTLTRRSYDSSSLQQMLRPFIKRNNRLLVNAYPTGDLVAAHAAAFTSGQEVDRTRVDELRTLAGGLLNADGGVFDPADKSSYTLANERFATRDRSDNRAGLFLTSLLTAGGDGDAAGLLRELLADESDPYTTLAMPLLADAPVREEGPGATEAQLAAVDDLLAPAPKGGLASPTLRDLRESFDRLARWEAGQGSKLNSLRRLVLFGCFAVHVHIVRRWSETDPGAPRPPILIDMFDGLRPPVRDASRATVRAAGESVQGLLFSRLRELFGEVDEETARVWLEPDRKAGEKKHADLVASFEANLPVEATPGDALAEACMQTGFALAGGAPLGFLTELGRRAGYMTPWANEGRGGKTQKRYALTAEFLETLVVATLDVERGERVSLDEFLDRLRDRFGILVGRRGDDAAVRRNNLEDSPWGPSTSIAEEDLRMNHRALRDAIVDSGYAKAYADGQTVVTLSPDRAAGL